MLPQQLATPKPTLSLAASLATATDSMPPWPSGSMLSAVLSRATSLNCSASCARVGTGAAAASSGTCWKEGHAGMQAGCEGKQHGTSRAGGACTGQPFDEHSPTPKAHGLTADSAACTTGSAAEAPPRRKARAGPSGRPAASAACSENTASDSWCASWLVRCSALRQLGWVGWGG